MARATDWVCVKRLELKGNGSKLTFPGWVPNPGVVRKSIEGACPKSLKSQTIEFSQLQGLAAGGDPTGAGFLAALISPASCTEAVLEYLSAISMSNAVAVRCSPDLT